MTRQLLFAIIISFTAANCIGQDCSCISRTKDKKTGIVSRGGITSSTDFYSLFFQKETNFKDSTITPWFILLLNAASRIVLPDSIVNSKRTIELTLSDSSKLYIENAKCFNSKMPFGLCIGLSANLTNEQLEIISKTPIITFTTLNIIKTSFKEKQQREQQRIAKCLLTEK